MIPEDCSLFNKTFALLQSRIGRVGFIRSVSTVVIQLESLFLRYLLSLKTLRCHPRMFPWRLNIPTSPPYRPRQPPSKRHHDTAQPRRKQKQCSPHKTNEKNNPQVQINPHHPRRQFPSSAASSPTESGTAIVAIAPRPLNCRRGIRA